MNFTYDPMQFAIMMDMNMNENSIYSNMVSGRDPPPLCVPIPTGPLPLGMEMCVKMFNIFTPGYNLHMCVALFHKTDKISLKYFLFFTTFRCMDIMAKIFMSELMVSRDSFSKIVFSIMALNYQTFRSCISIA